jgi:transcriptional regulator with GAF, ATPase, and Fis domain
MKTDNAQRLAEEDAARIAVGPTLPQLRELNGGTGPPLAGSSPLEEQPLLGLDGGLRALGSVLDRVAVARTIVLLRGETGTGKDLVAREIHRRSGRSGPFVATNCSALADGVLESELFGHESAAFTGARGTRIGRFEEADGGTLLLDEIGDVSAHVQVALLRVLQDMEFQRVGGNRTLHVDVRVIAATHAPLEEKIRRKEFREDLFYRLNVVRLQLPPLRNHRRDIATLAHHFIHTFGRQLGKDLSLTAAAVQRLEGQDWPGNVRQLRNVLERAAVLAAPADEIDAPDLDLDEERCVSEASARPSEVLKEVAHEEARRLTDALRDAGGSKTRAAQLLGIPRTTLNDRLRRLEATGS